MNTRRWQMFFLVGLVFFILAVLIAFGFSSLSLVIALVTLVITILNGLLSPAASQAGSSSWFVSWLRSILNVGLYLKIATIIIWAAGVCLFASKGWAAYRELQMIAISGYVESAAGDPMSDAFVTLQIGKKKWETVTSEGGKFTFEEVDTYRLKSERPMLKARWRGLTTSLPISFGKKNLASLRLRLPPGDPPFRVAYSYISGLAIDLALRGKLSKDIDDTLGGKSFIARTEPMMFLQKLVGRYQEHYPLGLEAVPEEPYNEEREGLREFALFAVGKGKFFATARVNEPASDKLLLAQSSLASWNAILSPNGPVDIWKFASKEELEALLNHNSKWYSFYRDTIRGFIPDCCILTTQMPGCVIPFVVAKQLTAELVSLENTTNRPIRIDSFRIKYHRGRRGLER